MRLPIVLLALFLCACAGHAPEPQTITREVKVAVPVTCKPNLGPRPNLMTKAQVHAATAAAATLDDQIKIIADQLLAYMSWTPQVEAALKGCEGPP